MFGKLADILSIRFRMSVKIVWTVLIIWLPMALCYQSAKDVLFDRDFKEILVAVENTGASLNYSYEVDGEKHQFNGVIKPSVNDSMTKDGKAVLMYYNVANPKQVKAAKDYEFDKIFTFWLIVVVLLTINSCTSFFWFPSIKFIKNCFVLLIAIFASFLIYIVVKMLYSVSTFNLSAVVYMVNGIWGFYVMHLIATLLFIILYRNVMILEKSGVVIRKKIVDVDHWLVPSRRSTMMFTELILEENTASENMFPESNILRVFGSKWAFKKGRTLTIIYDPHNHNNFRILSCVKD